MTQKLTIDTREVKTATRDMRELASVLGEMRGRLDEISSAFSRVLAPLANAVLPAFNNLADAALRVLNSLALLTARLFGGGAGLASFASGAKATSAALKSAGASAKSAWGSLAKFDKLDVLGQKSGGGSGGGGGTGIEIGGDLEYDESILAFFDRLMDKLRAFIDYVQTYFAPAIAAWGDAFVKVRAAVQDAMGNIEAGLQNLWNNGFVPLGNYLLYDFIPTIVNAFSETLAPIFSDVLSFSVREFGRNFEFAADMAVRAIHDMLLPSLDLLKTVLVGMLEGIGAAWDEYGGRILATWESVGEKLRGLITKVYEEIALPLFTALNELVDGLWNNHLQPLWNNLMLLFGAIGELVAVLWDSVLLPFISWVVDTFVADFVRAFGVILTVFQKIAGGILDGLSGIITALRGVIEFLIGAFTDDWARAWEGIKLIGTGMWEGLYGVIRGIINAIIALVNGMLHGITWGVNAVIGSLNSIKVTIPDWVPGYGGKSFSMSIPQMSVPQIPMLAKGAVIPPNSAFMAVLGDQTSGRNLEAPEGLIRQILQEELAGLNGGGDVNIRFTGSLAALARVLEPEIQREGTRKGASLIKGGAAAW